VSSIYAGRALRFEVRGNPRPQGSLTAWRTAAGSKARIAHAGGVPFRRWRASLANAAIVASVDSPPFRGPVIVTLTFRMPRPAKSKDSSPVMPPDVDKLARAVLDALSGIVYQDDGQVVVLTASKHWATPDDPMGVRISVEALLVA
jgi:Holliday junction resolvase RusA-like endonuclease